MKPCADLLAVAINAARHGSEAERAAYAAAYVSDKDTALAAAASAASAADDARRAASACDKASLAGIEDACKCAHASADAAARYCMGKRRRKPRQ